MDTLRHITLFNPDKFDNKILIIGVGATGSAVATKLIRLGVKPSLITVYDDDVIEGHNIANQKYYPDQIGLPKVAALQENCHRLNPSEKINIFQERVTKETDISQYPYIFLLVDCMDARKEIMEKIRSQEFPTFVFETRTDAETYRIYGIDSHNREHTEIWDRNWYPNEAATESLCGASTTIIDVIDHCAAQTVRCFILRVDSILEPNEKPYEFPVESIISLVVPEGNMYAWK